MVICYQCGCLVATYRANGKMVPHRGAWEPMCFGGVQFPRSFTYPFALMEMRAKERL